MHTRCYLLIALLLSGPVALAQTETTLPAPTTAPVPALPAPAPFTPQTLVGAGTGHHGFFVAPSFQMGPAQGDSRPWVGGRVAYQMNHRVALGFAGYGLTTQLSYDEIMTLPEYSPTRLSGGYGGLLLEYTLAPASLVHVSFPILVGAGGMAYTHRDLIDNGPDDDDYDYSIYDADAFFVVEPGVSVELNITRYLRLTAGAGYRYVDNLKLERTTSADLTGLTLNVGLKGGIL